MAQRAFELACVRMTWPDGGWSSEGGPLPKIEERRAAVVSALAGMLGQGRIEVEVVEQYPSAFG